MKIAHVLFGGDHRLEEAETNLVAKQEANALLNSQVDILTKQLQELQASKTAYEKHVKELSALLAKERRKHAPESEQVCDKRFMQNVPWSHFNVVPALPMLDNLAGSSS